MHSSSHTHLPTHACHPGNQLWHESDSADNPGFAGTCHVSSFDAAEALCESMGARLCTKAEVEGGCVAGTGCSYDDELIWTSTSKWASLAMSVQSEHLLAGTSSARCLLRPVRVATPPESGARRAALARRPQLTQSNPIPRCDL